MRGTASLVAFTMLLTSLPTQSLAQEADLYTQLETSNWGRDGTVTQYEYDDNGSLTRKTVTGAGESLVEEYTYDLQNRLASHVRTDSDETGTAVTTTAYRYSPAGGKVGQSTTVVMNGIARPELAETTNYLLDFSNPTGYAQNLEEFDGAGTLMKSYTIGDDVLSQSTRSAANSPLITDHFLYDGHGSTRQLSSSQGAVTAQYAYDAYGVMLGQTSGAQQRQATSLLYSGEQFDTSLQQYHLRARNYNQANGQFTTLDPYSGNLHDPQSLHKYAYCHTDPVNGVDPSGKNFTLTGLQVTMAIISGLGGIVGVRASGGSWTRAVFTGILYAAASIVTGALLIGVTAYWIIVGVKVGVTTVAQAIIELVMEAIPNEDGKISNVIQTLIMRAVFNSIVGGQVPNLNTLDDLWEDFYHGNKDAFRQFIQFIVVEFDWGMLSSIPTGDFEYKE